MSATPTLDEANRRIHAILTAADLEIGLAMTRGDTRVLIAGGGDEARLGVRAARRVLDAVTRVWGEDDLDVRLLATMTRVAESACGEAGE